jgi:hypothetical protein
MKNRETQKEVVFYLLYNRFKEDPSAFVPVHAFAAGDVLIKELHRWAFASFKCPARATEIYKENPGLLDRRKVRGKSGAIYYEYRIAPNPKPELIRDERLLDFYRKIKT